MLYTISNVPKKGAWIFISMLFLTLSLTGCKSGGGGTSGGTNPPPPPPPAFKATTFVSQIAFIAGDEALAVLNVYPLKVTKKTDRNGKERTAFFFEPLNGDEGLFPNAEQYGENAAVWFAATYIPDQNLVCVDAPSQYPEFQVSVSGDFTQDLTFRVCLGGEVEAADISDNWVTVFMEDFTAQQAFANGLLDGKGNFIGFNLKVAMDPQGDAVLYMENPSRAYNHLALVDLENNTICANFLHQTNGITSLQVSADVNAPYPFTSEGVSEFITDDVLLDVTLLRCNYNLAEWEDEEA